MHCRRPSPESSSWVISQGSNRGRSGSGSQPSCLLLSELRCELPANLLLSHPKLLHLIKNLHSSQPYYSHHNFIYPYQHTTLNEMKDLRVIPIFSMTFCLALSHERVLCSCRRGKLATIVPYFTREQSRTAMPCR